jgi:hypothetical protein
MADLQQSRMHMATSIQLSEYPSLGFDEISESLQLRNLVFLSLTWLKFLHKRRQSRVQLQTSNHCNHSYNDDSYHLEYMRAVHIHKYGRMPTLTPCPLPTRSAGQFLIRMKYAPINPSDLFFYLGLYGIRKEGFPIMGFEGSGVIKECDQEEFKGKTVSIFANKNNGTYAEYMVANPQETIVWPHDTPLSQQEISMCMVNPLSVLGMIDIIEAE